MDKRLIKSGIIILVLCIFIKLICVMFSNVKVDDFHPAAIIFIVDSSASNIKKMPEQKRILKQICSRLDPEDHVKIIKVSQDAYLIYEGSAQNTSGMNKSMEEFTKLKSNEYGTAYGDGIKKAFSFALSMKKEGYTPCIVVIGDLENEGEITKQLNWDVLPKNVSNVKKYVPEISVAFLFAHPKKLDLAKEKLSPVLGEKNLIIATEQNAEKSLRYIISAIGR